MTSAAVNNTAAGKAPLNNKTLGIGMVAFAVIEAVVTFFLVMKPLFINPVFNQCKAYNEEGKACIVKLFGKTFASQDEIANNQIILSLWDTILNIVLIYIVITGILLLLSFCYFKGFAFAKSYLIAVFGAKTVIALTPILVPFANFRNSMRIFGAIDAVICLAACIYCVYDSSSEYADDMLLTADKIANMWKRGKTAGVMFLIMAAAAIFAAFGMSAYGNIGNSGGNWSIVIGWLDNTSLAQGVVLILLVARRRVGYDLLLLLRRSYDRYKPHRHSVQNPVDLQDLQSHQGACEVRRRGRSRMGRIQRHDRKVVDGYCIPDTLLRGGSGSYYHRFHKDQEQALLQVQRS